MGEASKRKAREKAWRDGLSAREQVVFDVAQRLSSFLPPFGACYQGTFFLRYHLEKVHGIIGDAVVGFVNDGTDDLYGSHAWFEFEGQMTDLAISRPLHPELQHPGPLVIHGYEAKPGWSWSYHREEPPEGRAAFERFLKEPRVAGQMLEEQALRARMASMANDLDLIRDYLDKADNGLTYNVMAAHV